MGWEEEKYPGWIILSTGTHCPALSTIQIFCILLFGQFPASFTPYFKATLFLDSRLHCWWWKIWTWENLKSSYWQNLGYWKYLSREMPLTGIDQTRLTLNCLESLRLFMIFLDFLCLIHIIFLNDQKFCNVTTKVLELGPQAGTINCTLMIMW